MVVGYEFFLKLLKAEKEAEIDALLQEAGYFDHNPEDWRTLGNDDNNWGTVGNQHNHATGALVEKFINSVDAMLMAGCWKAGIEPESDRAPRCMSDAARDFFKVRNGRLDSMSRPERAALADNIHFVATGQKTKPNYLIIDRGEGQSPHQFPSTFLSLKGKNKYGIPFVQGINNCGGSAVLRFCGTRKYQLIVSRRNPYCPTAPDDKTRDLWGFTLVRQVLASQQLRPRRAMWYLAPGGQIPSFKAEEIPVLPVIQNRGDVPTPYHGGLPYGTCIKVYEYNWAIRSLATTNAREELEKYLYSLALPIRISETRDYTANYYQTTLSGMAVNIATQSDEEQEERKRGSRIEDNFNQLPVQINLPDVGHLENVGQLRVSVTVYRSKDKEGEPFETKRIPHGVVFTLNGQVHDRAAHDFIAEKLRYASLAKYMLVSVDCTGMSADAQHDFFTPARDRTVDGDVKKMVIDELVRQLTQEEPLRSALRELNARRRQELLKDTLNDDEPARVLEDLVRTSPALAALFSPGDRIHTPWVPEEDNTAPYVGKRYPTQFEIHNEPEDGLVKTCPINRTCRIQFDTDAENGYFNRSEDPGTIIFTPQGLNRSWNLRNGQLGATFSVPPNARVDDVVPVEVQVTDSSRIEPFVCRFSILVGEASNDTEPRSSSRKSSRGAGRLAMPEVIPVTRDGREIDGRPSIRYGDENEFNEFTALEIRPADEEGKYDILVNMDNVHLANELQREKKSSEHPLITYYFKYGLTLVAMGMLQEHRRQQQAKQAGEKAERNGDDAEQTEENATGYLKSINMACTGIAAVIVPVIQRLSRGPAKVLVED